MKKIALLLVVLILTTLALSGCAQKDAYDLYTAMSEKMASVKSLNMDLSGSFVINSDGQKQDLSLSGNIQEVKKSENDVDMAMNMKTSVASTDINIEEYYKNGVLYMSAMGQKLKMNMDLSKVKQQSNSDILNFERDAINSVTVTDVDGGKKLSFKLSAKSMTSYLNNTMNSLKSSLGVDLSKANFTFSDVTYDVIADSDNMIKSYHMNFTMNFEVNGKAASVDYDITTSLKSVNDVTITFPADLDTYTEQTLPSTN